MKVSSGRAVLALSRSEAPGKLHSLSEPQGLHVGNRDGRSKMPHRVGVRIRGPRTQEEMGPREGLVSMRKVWLHHCLLDTPALEICSLLVQIYSRVSRCVSSDLGLDLCAAGKRGLSSLCQGSHSKKGVPDIKGRARRMLARLCSLIWSSKCTDDK